MAPRRPHHRPRDRSVECELKFRVAGPRNHARIRAALRKRGAKLEGKYQEENYRFDGPGISTRQSTLRLRVLNGGPRGVITVKGPAHFVGGVKVREETEVEVKDAHATLDLLAQLGFAVEFTYNKHRAIWTLDGVVSVTLDTLDYGWFVELEGPLEVLPTQARSLGFNPAKALKDSYSVLARSTWRRPPGQRGQARHSLIQTRALKCGPDVGTFAWATVSDGPRLQRGTHYRADP